ncbi:MAG: SDR family oxidoreductase [Ginsengibacter sp.]
MFKDKVIAITGGSEGIGKALTEVFLKNGAKVATCGRNKIKLETLSNDCATTSLLTLVADVSIQDDCKKFIDQTIEKFDGIDILINNAGISMRTLFRDTDLKTLKNVMDINFWGSVYCTKYAIESIIERKGSIVGVSSIAGYRGLPGRSGYSASKFALNGWLEALRTELLETGVNVLWVSPGFTASNIRNVALNESAQPQGESPMDESKLMSAEECARNIIDAIEKRKRSLVLTFTGKQTVFMNKFFPAWSDKLVRKFFFKNGKLIK